MNEPQATDAERKQLHDELARRAQAIRDEKASQSAARTPGVLETLDALGRKVDDLADLAGEVGALRAGLTAAFEAASDEEELPAPRRRDHLRLIRNDNLEAG